MTNQEFQVSVVIPTHNRSLSLRRALDALALQDYPIGQIEVVVVADGCTDDTVALIEKYKAPFPIRLLEQPWQGPASARNLGGSVARGELLIFIDDDIEPATSYVRAHVEAHERRPGHVVIGCLTPLLSGPNDFFHIELRRWWETMFDIMSHVGHRYTYLDLLTGNLAVEAKIFRTLGGFDASLWCHEDYEFGVRLIKAGVPLVFAPEALAYHHEGTDLDRALERKYEEGRADILMGNRHPELRPGLPLAVLRGNSSSSSRLLCDLAFRSPGGTRRLLAWLKLPLNLFETLHIRRYWGKILSLLLVCSYWMGVKEQVGTIQALDDFLKAPLASPMEKESVIELDLQEGIEAAERKLDVERPSSVTIRYGNQLVGRILPQPGSESLRGAHLRPVLATKLARPLAKALAKEGVLLDLHVSSEHLMRACALDSVEPELFDVVI